jgi:hypothetical protein
MLIPIELRVHAAPGGVSDLLERRVELHWFIARLGDFSYERRSASGEPAGLVRICPRERFDRAVDELAEGFGREPLGAAEVFVHRYAVAPREHLRVAGAGGDGRVREAHPQRLERDQRAARLDAPVAIGPQLVGVIDHAGAEKPRDGRRGHRVVVVGVHEIGP